MLSLTSETVSLNDRKDLEYKLGEIAEKIEDQGRKRRVLADILRKAKEDFRLPMDDEEKSIVESDLVYNVENLRSPAWMAES